jgi:ABC-type lipoprotein export system ATPase subunit
MGQSGCGKSTLLHLLGGLLSPTSGKIIIDGEDLSKVSDAQRTDIRRRKIGFVFQRFNLFPTLTADGNLKLAERIHSGNGGGNAENRREVLRLLKLENKMHTNRSNFPAASSSESRWRARSSTIRRLFWRTSRPAISTRKIPKSCLICSAN